MPCPCMSTLCTWGVCATCPYHVCTVLCAWGEGGGDMPCPCMYSLCKCGVCATCAVHVCTVCVHRGGGGGATCPDVIIYPLCVHGGRGGMLQALTHVCTV